MKLASLEDLTTMKRMAGRKLLLLVAVLNLRATVGFLRNGIFLLHPLTRSQIGYRADVRTVAPKRTHPRIVAVTHPRPEFFIQGGTRSSTDAVHRTWVSPHLIRQDPSAWREMPVSMEMARISDVSRPDGLISSPLVERAA